MDESSSLDCMLQWIYHTPEYRNVIIGFNLLEGTDDTNQLSDMDVIIIELQRLFVGINFDHDSCTKFNIESNRLQQAILKKYRSTSHLLDVSELLYMFHEIITYITKKKKRINDINCNGYFVHLTECYQCGEKTERKELFQELIVNINNANITNLSLALHNFVEPEIMNQDNRYYCSLCKCKNNKSLKSIQIGDPLPAILPIRLNVCVVSYTVHTNHSQVYFMYFNK